MRSGSPPLWGLWFGSCCLVRCKDVQGLGVVNAITTHFWFTATAAAAATSLPPSPFPAAPAAPPHPPALERVECRALYARTPYNGGECSTLHPTDALGEKAGKLQGAGDALGKRQRLPSEEEPLHQPTDLESVGIGQSKGYKGYKGLGVHRFGLWNLGGLRIGRIDF